MQPGQQDQQNQYIEPAGPINPVQPEPYTQPVEEQSAQQVPQSVGNEAVVQWQAPEYIENARMPLWYVGFWAVVIILVILAIFVLRSWSFAILVPAMAAALMIYSHRPPRMFSYALSHKGLYINDQLHPMTEFKSFGVMQNDQLPYIVLIPTKRFRPSITVYFPNEFGESIVDLLGSRMPMQEVHLDVFDRIIRKLRI